MKPLTALLLVAAMLRLLLAVPAEKPAGITEDTLKELSAAGEELLEEEVSRALYGVQQMKEVMRRNQQKHQHLLTSLRYSADKKHGAVQLEKEVTEKLVEAEEECKESLQSEWEECRPCLEEACSSFYSSSCRRGFSAFQAKLGNFFQRVSQRFDSRQPVEGSRDGEGSRDILVNQDLNSLDPNITQMEASFSQVLHRVGVLVERSAALVSRMSGRLDRGLREAFLNDTGGSPTEEPPTDLLDPGRDSGFLQGVGLDRVLESFYDFGRSVLQEFGAAVTQGLDDAHTAVRKERISFPRFLHNRMLCRNLRKQASECWRLRSRCEACQGALLTECPSVQELHVELDEVSQLLDVSRDQYQEVLTIVQQHLDHTLSCLSDMAAQVSWVGQVIPAFSNHSLFYVTMVTPQNQNQNQKRPPSETRVEVNLLNSPPLLLSVPGGLQVQEPAFIQYVIQEALDQYKQTLSFDGV